MNVRAIRLSAWTVGAAVTVTALVAFFRTERTPEPVAPPSDSAPPGGGGASPGPTKSPPRASAAPPPTGLMAPMPTSAGEDAPAITWSVPAGWRPVPNPNGMRLATYRPSSDSDGDAAEVSVSRAGGSTDANIQRWRGQFTDADQARRAQKTVRGLPITLVEISGTYSAGAMMQGPSGAASHPGWALVAAIVETPGTSYCFTMVGPAERVRAARAPFDALVDSIAPR